MSNQYYYVTGNTAEGFINHLDSNIESMKQIIVLKHPSNTLKTTVITQLIKKYEADFDLEILHSTLGNKFLDGVIIRELSLAIIVDQLSLSEIPGAIDIDLNLFLNDELLPDDLLGINNQYQSHTQAAYDNFSTGLKIHDDLEEIYIGEMDFDKADQLAKSFITNLLKDAPKSNESTHTYHRLFGTNTQDGVVNVVPHLIENLSNVYFIKGRAGTGKSTFMKKIAKACEEHGFDIEMYHCSFDPNSIDMVLVRALDFCIFDSTDPHEFFPAREGESIVDLYEEAVTAGTDEKFENEINKLNNPYKFYMKKGIQDLNNAGEYLELHEQQYTFTENELQDIINFVTGKIIQ
ncbi:hypothetical protein KFZ58_13245 [Virgibacillus sp. NKC19-16]|uniref:hypothetical protein n=1 Tax=Virgibacillus salidurans TaxID=2831673 RepID=UPI001F35EC20|nr:hypothetical protein [Virgibacillus sp. NKC19-16]UJL45368.1 hypothetical protein KFZ58_13245 [Virgibacillus sp. NKC19-16]